MNNCKVIRMKKVTTKNIMFDTGEEVDGSEKVYWVKKACGSHLWTEKTITDGVCNSCNEGWKTKDNYPLDTPLNRKLIPHLSEALAGGWII